MVVIALLAVSACQPRAIGAIGPTVVYSAATPLPVERVWLSSSNDNGRYSIAFSPGRAVISAPGTVRGDGRTVITPTSGAAISEDQESCATVTTIRGPLSQPGVALRVRRERTRTRALTVTQNIMFGVRTAFNVHGWDSSVRGADGQLVLGYLHGFDLRPALTQPDGTLKPLPWRLCARVHGLAVDVKVWPTAEAEPAWGDVEHGGSVNLPAKWDYAGRAGWFAGHLTGGGSLTLTDLRTWSVSGS